MTGLRLPTTIAAIAAAGVIFATAPAAAQAQQQQMQVNDTELQAYASAAVEIQQISQEWQPRIDATQNADEKSALREQAQAEMVEAIRAEDLTVEKYNNIYRLAQADPDVRQRVVSYMQQAE